MLWLQMFWMNRNKIGSSFKTSEENGDDKVYHILMHKPMVLSKAYLKPTLTYSEIENGPNYKKFKKF
jgi:hypothetical protein